MLTKSGQRTMMVWFILTELLHLKAPTKCWHQHFLSTLLCSTLLGCTGWWQSLDHFWLAFNALSDCLKLIFNWAFSVLPNLNHMVSHGLGPVGLRFKGLNFGRLCTWLGMSNMNFLIADVIYITFSQGGGTKVKSKEFSEFGSRTIRTEWIQKKTKFSESIRHKTFIPSNSQSLAYTKDESVTWSFQNLQIFPKICCVTFKLW